MMSRASRIATRAHGARDLRWQAMPTPERPEPMIRTSTASFIANPFERLAQERGGLVERAARLRHEAVHELPYMRRAVPDLQFRARTGGVGGVGEAHGIVAQDFALADMQQHRRQTREIAEQRRGADISRVRAVEIERREIGEL